jgi:hypothetical protein
MVYNFEKDTCDRCGVSQENAPIVDTGINHPEYRYSNSFQLGLDGSVLCMSCHREFALERLFVVMDARDKERNNPTK